jgi:hypothetical protein
MRQACRAGRSRVAEIAAQRRQRSSAALVHDLGVIDRVSVGVGFVAPADASAKRCA